MVGLRSRMNLRRWGYGLALGAGMALAPFAIATASAEPTAPVAEAHLPVQAVPAAKAPAPVVQRVVPAAAPRIVVPAKARSVAPPKVQRSIDRRPVVVVGASIASGHAVSKPAAFPSRISAATGRPVYVSARNGAAYHDGSIAQLAAAADIASRNPALVVLQAGSNDVGAPTADVAGQVRQVVQTVRAEAPNAKIAVVTVFPTLQRGADAARTDAAIIGAARSVDPSVAVISPLAEGWRYKPTGDGHPATAGHQQVADRLASLA